MENKNTSTGHMATIGSYEYFLKNGQLYRANVVLPVMPDGYRCGRWICSESKAAEFVKDATELFELGPFI